MAEIINLNRVRKAQAREERAREATENRIRFGRGKAEKKAAEAEAERAADRHEGHRLDREKPGRS